MTRSRALMFQIVDALVDRAREHGVARADITGTDVILVRELAGAVNGRLPGAEDD